MVHPYPTKAYMNVELQNQNQNSEDTAFTISSWQRINQSPDSLKPSINVLKKEMSSSIEENFNRTDQVKSLNPPDFNIYIICDKVQEIHWITDETSPSKNLKSKSSKSHRVSVCRRTD